MIAPAAYKTIKRMVIIVDLFPTHLNAFRKWPRTAGILGSQSIL